MIIFIKFNMNSYQFILNTYIVFILYFLYLNHIDYIHVILIVYESGVVGRRGRGRPNRVWTDGVRKALNNRVEWRYFVNRIKWMFDMELRFRRKILWWVVVGCSEGAGNSCMLDKLNYALGCVETCRSKDDRWWLALCSSVFCYLELTQSSLEASIYDFKI